MSNKRQATSDLNHENWDRDDSPEKEAMGAFKAATPDVLEKRVIRTAKRRFQTSNDEPKKSVFSGFGGFNKTQPSSFDFLANLTNGNKNVNGGTNGQANTLTPSSSLFGSSTIPSSINSDTAKSPAPGRSAPSATSSLFGNANTAKSELPLIASKTSSSGDNLDDTTNKNKEPSPSLFGLNAYKFDSTKSLFSSSNTSATKVEMAPTPKTPVDDKKAETKNEATNDENKMRYYSKLKGLNESVSEWIKKHVEATPLCILSPIFKDYEKHLSEIQSEFKEGKEGKSNNNVTDTNKTTFTNNLDSTPAKPSIFGISNTIKSFSKEENQLEQKTTGFTFGINPPAINTSAPTNTGFTFGIKPLSPVSSPFSLATNIISSPSTTISPSLSSNTATTNSNGGTPFSFGMGKPFSFGANIQASKAAEPAKEEDEEDEPPKVEFTPVVEDSVYDKRCKVFVKKNGNFTDKGVGTLYIKKVEDSDKHQLLVRANTNLGNVLLNMILSSDIPTQRLGKNNVMMVCIPTPEAEPPPTPVLIRVKSAEEADELLETLNKYKA